MRSLINRDDSELEWPCCIGSDFKVIYVYKCSVYSCCQGVDSDRQLALLGRNVYRLFRKK